MRRWWGAALFVLMFVGCTSGLDLGTRPADVAGGEAGVTAEGGVTLGDADVPSNGNDGAIPDGGSVADADADDIDAGPFAVSNLPGLALWLEGTAGIVPDPNADGGILHWLDQSGNGNDATVSASEKPAGAHPTIDPAVLNGLDAVSCGSDAAFDISDALSLQWTSDFALAMVLRISNSSATPNYPWRKNDNGPGLALEFQQSAAFTLHAGSALVSAANPAESKFHILIARGEATELLIDDQTSTGPTNMQDLSAVGSAAHFCIAKQPNSPDYFEYAEIIAIKGTLSDPTLSQLQAYLKSKYAL